MKKASFQRICLKIYVVF